MHLHTPGAMQPWKKPVIMCAHLQLSPPLGSPPLAYRDAIVVCIVLSFVLIRQAGVRKRAAEHRPNCCNRRAASECQE